MLVRFYLNKSLIARVLLVMENLNITFSCFWISFPSPSAAEGIRTVQESGPAVAAAHVSHPDALQHAFSQ